MERTELARRIGTGLRLAEPPVALRFVEEPPAGTEVFEGRVPSACSFWRRAETRVFYAAGADHFHCPVGAMVMGFELPETVQRELAALVQGMCERSYLAAEEAGRIPVVEGRHCGILYGPLRDLPLEPDLILLWLTPRQAMLFGEAAGSCAWTESLPTTALGRPACAALPTALRSARPTLSLGCIGMRTFTEISEDRVLAVLPAARAEEFVERLETTLAANQAMESFYRDHRAKFTT